MTNEWQTTTHILEDKDNIDFQSILLQNITKDSTSENEDKRKEKKAGKQNPSQSNIM